MYLKNIYIYQVYKENLDDAETGRCLKCSECVYVYVMYVMLTVANNYEYIFISTKK